MVLTVTSPIHKFNVASYPTDTGIDIKRRIHKLEGILVSEKQLLKNGKELHDNEALVGLLRDRDAIELNTVSSKSYRF